MHFCYLLPCCHIDISDVEHELERRIIRDKIATEKLSSDIFCIHMPGMVWYKSLTTVHFGRNVVDSHIQH
jgi:hypothetical protein